jgi:hypothetical protein
MTTTPETRPALNEPPSPRNHLTAMCHSVLHAIELTKAGNHYEAGEHVEAVDRLIGGYWTAMGEPRHGTIRQDTSSSFPEGAAVNRLKEALKEFRATQPANSLADDLDAALGFLEFARGDIAQLRKAWAAVTGCLMKQARHQYLTDADLADVPSSHRAFFLGRDAMRRELLSVVAERDALKDEGAA